MSHASMDVFWSGTDEQCVKDLGGEEGDYYISLVTNRENNLLVRLDVYNPFRATFDELPLQIGSETPGLREQCKAEVKEKVKSIPTVVTHWRAPSGRYSGRNIPGERSYENAFLGAAQHRDFQEDKLYYGHQFMDEWFEEDVDEALPDDTDDLITTLRKRAQEAEEKWVQSISAS